MIKLEVAAAFNKQINAEAYSAYLYLAMAAWFERRKLPGFAHWMVVQSQEELSHAMLLYRYVVNNGGEVQFSAIDAPPREWENPVDCVAAILAHEKLVTSLINQLVATSLEYGDKAAAGFLEWFVEEQEEEEESAENLLQQVSQAANSAVGLSMLNNELKNRNFHMPGNLVF